MLLLTAENRKNLPKLYSQEHVKDPIVWVKFFDPTGSYTLYVTEFDGKDILFGYVTGVVSPELGYTSLAELASTRVRFGLGIERDRYFDPMPLSWAKNNERNPDPKGSSRYKVTKPAKPKGRKSSTAGLGRAR